MKAEEANVMTEQDWKERYKDEFVRAVGMDPDEAQEIVDDAEFPGVMEDYENDPEGAAQLEISYWEPSKETPTK